MSKFEYLESMKMPYPVDHSVGEHDEPEVAGAGFEFASGLGCADAACGVLAPDANADLRCNNVNERHVPKDRRECAGSDMLLTKKRHAVRMLNMPTASPL